MAWRYVEGRTTADLCFEATGATLEEMLGSAVDAVTAAMVTDLASVRPRETRELSLSAESAEMLLFDLLQEVIFLKDAHGLLLRAGPLQARRDAGRFTLTGSLRGERIDGARHELGVDVKAVTLSGYEVRETFPGWEARAVIDV